MFSKALLATDLSPASETVVDYVKTLRPLGCREILLMHVLYVKHTVGLTEVLMEEARPKLQEQKARLEAEGFLVDVETPSGVPGYQIASTALETGCKVIVIGSHGHTMAREVALGGVATDVVHRSKAPVLVVRLWVAEGEEAPCPGMLSTDIRTHVLHATDFSDNAERAFQYLETIVESGCRKVTLVHVQDVGILAPYLEDRLNEFNAIDRARLERLKDRLVDLGAEDVQIEIPYGSPAKEILDLMRRNCPSLVVMGTHGRGFIAEMFIGSVSHNVARHSYVPLLLIPPAR